MRNISTWVTVIDIDKENIKVYISSVYYLNFYLATILERMIKLYSIMLDAHYGRTNLLFFSSSLSYLISLTIFCFTDILVMFNEFVLNSYFSHTYIIIILYGSDKTFFFGCFRKPPQYKNLRKMTEIAGKLIRL